MNSQDPTTTPTSENEKPFLAAASRLRERLTKGGLSDDTISFILGRFVSKVSNKTMDEVVEKLSDQMMSPEVGGIVDDAQRQAKIEQLFKDRTGKTIQERREEIAEEMVQEFEALGAQAGKPS